MYNITQFFQCFEQCNSIIRYWGLFHLTYSSFLMCSSVLKKLGKIKTTFSRVSCSWECCPGFAKKMHSSETWKDIVTGMRVATHGEMGSLCSLVAYAFCSFVALLEEVLKSGFSYHRH